MNRKTKSLKSRYRGACTKRVETHDKNGRVISRTRVRAKGAPSLKEWASGMDDGDAWRSRKRKA